MPRDVPPLTTDEVGRIAETLDAWGERHPAADDPVIQLGDGSELTPRDIAAAAREPQSPRGQLLYRAFAAALIEDRAEPFESLDEILGDYRSDLDAWDSPVARG